MYSPIWKTRFLILREARWRYTWYTQPICSATRKSLGSLVRLWRMSASTPGTSVASVSASVTVTGRWNEATQLKRALGVPMASRASVE